MWSIGDDMMAEGTYEPGDAVTEYYRRRGWVDEEGNVTKPKTFPQEALEAAQKRESDSISNLGIEDPNIRAMGRGNGLTAKEMLENKKLVVETDE
jgi:hypothetical protein